MALVVVVSWLLGNASILWTEDWCTGGLCFVCEVVLQVGLCDLLIRQASVQCVSFVIECMCFVLRVRVFLLGVVPCDVFVSCIE